MFVITGLVTQSLQLQAQVAMCGTDVRNLESVQSRVHIDQFVSVFAAVEVPVYFCLRSSCMHVTEVRGPKVL